MKTKTQPTQSDYSQLAKPLAAIQDELSTISTRLDVMINLILDLLPEDRLGDPHEFTPKLRHLDLTRWDQLRPKDAGKIFGRPSKDISSRRKEIAAAKKKHKKSKKAIASQARDFSASESQ